MWWLFDIFSFIIGKVLLATNWFLATEFSSAQRSSCPWSLKNSPVYPCKTHAYYSLPPVDLQMLFGEGHSCGLDAVLIIGSKIWKQIWVECGERKIELARTMCKGYTSWLFLFILENIRSFILLHWGRADFNTTCSNFSKIAEGCQKSQGFFFFIFHVQK